MRKIYSLSPEQYKAVITAGQPVSGLIIGGVEPRTTQQNVDSAWQTIAKEMGFVWDSFKEAPGLGNECFSAEAIESPAVGMNL